MLETALLFASLAASPALAAAGDDPVLQQEPPAPESDRPLAVPAPGRPPPDVEEDVPPRRLGHFDVGYRLLWRSNDQVPIQGRLGPRPHLIHATGHALLEKSVLLGASFETTLDPMRGSQPFVLDLRIGWWDGAFAGSQPRGPIRTLPGTRMTYVGWRIVHDHYRGRGGAWAGESSAAGLVAGYTYSAPLGRLTVTTDSQFTLYLLGWKGRSDLPVGLLNQRVSLGFDPLFIDVRFRADPGTGEELSVGVSLQGLFGLERRSRRD